MCLDRGGLLVATRELTVHLFLFFLLCVLPNRLVQCTVISCIYYAEVHEQVDCLGVIWVLTLPLTLLSVLEGYLFSGDTHCEKWDAS